MDRLILVVVAILVVPGTWCTPVVGKARQLHPNIPDNEPEPAVDSKRSRDLDSQGAGLGLSAYSSLYGGGLYSGGLGGINPYAYGIGNIGSAYGVNQLNALGGLGGYGGLGGLGGLGGYGGLGGLGGLGGYGGLGGLGLGGYGGLGLGGLGGYGGYSEGDSREERIRRKLIKTLAKINKQQAAASQGDGQVDVVQVQGFLTPYGYGSTLGLGGLGPYIG